MFTTYSMTEDDAIQSSILTTQQKHNIQNQVAILAEKKLMLEPNVSSFEDYIQKEAYYRGQIDALNYLLECSTNAERLS